MQDCATDILAFHNEKVTLLQPQRTAMRDRRDANRDRLVSRLKADENPTPKEFIKQGSYAMLTMVQDPDNDYDIDDGVYFTQASLQDKDGNDMSPRDARQMVCDALLDDRFNKQPQVKKNCVRIFYQEGYHVDMPIYRIREVDGQYELACGDEWVVSRAADVEKWFNTINQTNSPDENNGRQFRRIVRLLKKFARSRAAWKERIASGFTITKLAEECYVANKDQEDIALRNTMRSIHNRLLFSLEVRHPVTPGAMLTSGPNDSGTRFLREKLGEALEDLAVLDNPICTRKEALAAWDKVFDTDFFSARCKDEDEKGTTAANAGIFANLVATRKDPQAVDKRGGGRFA
jgi:hypothetical protein